ncbi:MAG: hypothetical protein ACO3VQ_05140 [Ilumatobacteraceae bacterium]
MDKEQATMLVGYLVGATTGWNDEAVVIYVDELMRHNEYSAMETAVRNIAVTWREPRRPPIAVILDAYRSELAKRQSAALPPARNGQRVSVREGLQIAQKAYEGEMRRRGKEPDPKRVAKWFGLRS